MTALAHGPEVRRPARGGIAARRALARWTWRTFRREWRQQLLVLALLTFAVAAAVFSITIVHHTVPPDDARFGTANHLLTFDGADPRRLAAGLAAAKRSFGTTDVIAHRSVTVPGTVEPVDFRAQDPYGPYGAALLALRSGSYPRGASEVAVTDGVARRLGLRVRSSLTLGGQRRTVVGIVENPRDLGDEFALVMPGSVAAPDHVSVLVDASDGAIRAFFTKAESLGRLGLTGSETNDNDHPEADTLAMLSVTTVFVLLASLIAAAGFAVVAQRRLRQLGMLTAVGATRKHLRLVLVSNGLVVGAIAALAGTLAGVALWAIAAPTLESAIGHRVARLGLPWGPIALTVVLATAGAAAAAWWPGRTVVRVPVVLALSGRPPRPRPARHAAIAAAALLAAGVGSLALSDRDRPPLVVAGILATIAGCLLLGPPAIRVFAGVAGRVPIAPRLALRDLVRYQARSGAALAAITLALGIAAAIVIVTGAEQGKRLAAPPNLSDRQLRIYTGPAEARELVPIQARGRRDLQAAGAAQIAKRLGDATVIPLRRPLEPGAPPIVAGDARGLPPIELARRIDSGSQTTYRAVSELFVATPAVLEYLGIDPRTIDPRTDFLADRSVRTDQLVFPDLTGRDDVRVERVQRIDSSGHLFGGDRTELAPPTFITPNGVRRHGWKQAGGGWLVESRRPLTSHQIAATREVAAQSGLSIELQRSKDAALTRAMAIATGAGAVLALAILALTVGLIRSESAAELRTLAATGAGPRIRRTLTATTAGALALLGALLGVAGAYVVLAATYADDLGYLRHIPVLYLALAVLGVPVAAAAAGWLVAGREPPAVSRAAIE